MNTRAFTLALVLSCIAMFMVWSYIDGERAAIISSYGRERPVVVAKEDINELDLIDSKKLAYKLVPANFVLPGYYSKIEELENTIATVPILKDEQITRPRVTYPGAKGGLAREITPGKRAFSVAVSAANAASKLIKPGDRVDIFATIDYSRGVVKNAAKTQLILQDILVLATGRHISNSLPIEGIRDGDTDAVKKMNLNVNSQYDNITLELDPYEVQKILFARNLSSSDFYYALRNNNDKKQIKLRGTQATDVLNEEDRAVASEFLNGGQRPAR